MLHLPPLYPITDASRPEPLSAQIRRLGEAGFPLVQFRGKPLDAKAQWLELRAALAEAAANGGWPFICVNDRTDLAMLAAQEGLAPWGLHLGQGDLPAAEAARLPGPGRLPYRGLHPRPAEWETVDAACDHAGVGPFRGTATKSDHAEPIGLDGLRVGCAALRARGLAPIAIGGLGPADATACFEAGAESLAMVGEIQRSADPATLGWEVQRAALAGPPALRRGQGIVILGGSGAGKSTLGRLLAQRLGLAFHDLDDVIEANQGVPVSAIFAELGESAFRALESALLPALLTDTCRGGPGRWRLGGSDQPGCGRRRRFRPPLAGRAPGPGLGTGGPGSPAPPRPGPGRLHGPLRGPGRGLVPGARPASLRPEPRGSCLRHDDGLVD